MTAATPTPGSWDWLRAQGQTIDVLIESQRALAKRIDDELAEIRDGFVELDHRIKRVQEYNISTRDMLLTHTEDTAA